MSRLPTYNHSLCIQLEKFFFHHGSNRSCRPCPGTRTAKLNVGQLHVLATGPREASRWLWMHTFKNIYFNILSVLVLVPVPGLLWTSLYQKEFMLLSTMWKQRCFITHGSRLNIDWTFPMPTMEAMLRFMQHEVKKISVFTLSSNSFHL